MPLASPRPRARRPHGPVAVVRTVPAGPPAGACAAGVLSRLLHLTAAAARPRPPSPSPGCADGYATTAGDASMACVLCDTSITGGDNYLVPPATPDPCPTCNGTLAMCAQRVRCTANQIETSQSNLSATMQRTCGGWLAALAFVQRSYRECSVFAPPW